MSKVVRGSDLLSGQSSIHFSQNREYIANRRVELLKELNVPADVMAIVNRANNIFDTTGPVNNPTLDKQAATIARDQHVALMEVYRMEEPENYNYLFGANTAGQPDEKAALRKVSSYFEVPPMKADTVVTVNPVRYEDRSVSSLPIANLPRDEWKVAAARLQQELATNSDGDAGTITRQDLERAIANPGPFTPDSINSFQGILDYMTRPHALLPGPVSPPNLHKDAVLNVDFHFVAPISYAPENNAISVVVSKPTSYNSHLEVTIPAGAKLLAHQLDPQGQVINERIYGSDTKRVEFRELGSEVPPNSSIWLQVFSAQGEVISNVRLPIPTVKLSDPVIPASFPALRKLRVLNAAGQEAITNYNHGGVYARKEADNVDSYLR